MIFWDIGRRFKFRRNFDRLPFTPPLVAGFGPSIGIRAGWGFQYLNRFENHSATIASLGKIPVFFGEDYAYWKVRMRAFLLSMGAEGLGYYQEPGLRGACRSDLTSSGV